MSNQAAVKAVEVIEKYLSDNAEHEFCRSWTEVISKYKEPETRLSFTAFAYHEKAPFFQMLVMLGESGEDLVPESKVAIGFYHLMGDELTKLTDDDKLEISMVTQDEAAKIQEGTDNV